ncbi:MAG: VanZ family protein [Acidobacteria bacterium]|nr:VanZ family protein [Acidobacteriota bacterium]
MLAWLAWGQVPEQTRMWRAAFNAGHLPLFGILALVAEAQLRRSRPRDTCVQHALWALAATTVLGVAAEALQTLVPNRSASLIDVARNIAGSLAFLVAAAAWRARREWRPAVRASALAFAAILLIAGAADLVRAVAVHVALQQSLPFVARLDGAWWERDVVDPGANVLEPSGATGMARLILNPAEYSGVALDEPWPDWRAYAALELQVRVPSAAPMQVSLRINDAEHDNSYRDRFNTVIDLQPGVNSVRVSLEDVRHAPAGRPMDLAHIRTVILFVHDLDHQRALEIGPIRLVP